MIDINRVSIKTLQRAVEELNQAMAEEAELIEYGTKW
jgi:hypothetical protein